MSRARFIVGDVREQVEQLPDGSVDLVLTSPPFLALRSYLPDDHPDKVKEIGSEPTPADFLDTLLDLTELWRRKLAPHGSIAVELGDTYSGSGDPGWSRTINPAHRSEGRMRGGTGDGRARDTTGGWPPAKSLTFVPSLYGASLAYGRNLLRPEHTIEPWRVRNVVAWCRPNPPVGALGDKFRPGTSYLTIATVARDRYFDLDAVRQPGSPNTHAHGPAWNDGLPTKPNQVTGSRRDDGQMVRNVGNPAGAPPLDWWEIPTEPFPGQHFATFPRKLLTRPILAMCPQRVCTTCGEPSRRIVEATPEYAAFRAEQNTSYARGDNSRLGAREASGSPGAFDKGGEGARVQQYQTLGWSDCGHDTWRNGLVLDPFAGSGTTLAVATGLGRDAIGIDLDERNADLARDRVGMFLDVEQAQQVADVATGGRL